MTPEIPGQRNPEPAPEKPRYTSKGLPVVSPATVDAMKHAFENSDDWNTYLYEVKKRLIKENPVLAFYIRQEVTLAHPAMSEKLLDVVAGTLAVLERQAEANNLADKFNPPNPPSKK